MQENPDDIASAIEWADSWKRTPIAEIPLPHYDRLIVAAGMPRSGSTWQFNAIKSVLKTSGRTVFGGWPRDIARFANDTCDDLLIKVHAPEPHLGSLSPIIFTSHRDLRDVAASALEVGVVSSKRDLPIRVSYWRDGHEYWSQRAALDIGYADIIRQPRSVIEAIAAKLGLSLPPGGARIIADELRVLKAAPNRMGPRHDIENMMTLNHRSDGRPGSWRERLPRGLAKKIVMSNRGWMERYGYVRSESK
jgi:hypothetical protein